MEISSFWRQKAAILIFAALGLVFLGVAIKVFWAWGPCGEVLTEDAILKLESVSQRLQQAIEADVCLP